MGKNKAAKQAGATDVAKTNGHTATAVVDKKGKKAAEQAVAKANDKAAVAKKQDKPAAKTQAQAHKADGKKSAQKTSKKSAKDEDDDDEDEDDEEEEKDEEEEEDDDEDEDEEEEDDDDDEEEEEEKAPAAKGSAKRAAAAADDDDEEEEDDDEDDDEDEDEDEEDKAPSRKKAAAAADDDEDEEEDDDEDEEEEEEEDEEEKQPAKKAKQDSSDESATVFVGRLSYNTTEDGLKAYFEEAGITVHAVRVRYNDDGSSRGFAHLDLPASDVEKALGLAGSYLDGRPINVDRSTPKGDTPRKDRNSFGGDAGFSPRAPSEPSDTLFLKGLPYSSSEDDVYSVFAGAKSVRLPTDRETGKPKGIAYVQFEDVDSATAAKDQAGELDIGGRRVYIDFATSSRGGSGDRGGFRGGFRGGRGGDRGGFRGGRGGFGGDNMSRQMNQGSIAGFQGQKKTFDD